eukprot:GCRY01003825.1.p2 GENE.GCRY01003825.1~~GCRY01003825.1.p2  ORF type:complete len:205 (+),score=41.87 GCRY01003825.1:852-1466(+)
MLLPSNLNYTHVLPPLPCLWVGIRRALFPGDILSSLGTTSRNPFVTATSVGGIATPTMNHSCVHLASALTNTLSLPSDSGGKVRIDQACCLWRVPKGSATLPELRETEKLTSFLRKNSFSPLIHTPRHTILPSPPPFSLPSLTVARSGTEPLPILAAIAAKAKRQIRAGAYLHWYRRYGAAGLDQLLDDSLERLDQIISTLENW